MAIVSISGLAHEYRNAEPPVRLFDELDLEIEESEFLVILGPNGSGKTTLLNLLAGFDRPTAGRILLEGVPVEKPSTRVGVVFQEFSLLPWKTVLGNVLMGLEIQRAEPAEARAKADRVLELLGLAEYRDYYPRQLSGGMKQKTAIARALAVAPQVLLMDEPLTGIDVATRASILEELVAMWARTKKTIVYVTHDLEEAVQLATRVVVFDSKGSIVASLPGATSPPPTSGRGTRPWLRDRIREVLT